RPAEDLLAARGGANGDSHRLRIGIDRLDPAAEDDFGALAVVGYRHHSGETHVVLADGAGIADPGGDVTATKAHGQHAVRNRDVQAHQLGDLVVPVDGVQIAGNAGVVDEVLTGQRDDPLRQLIPDLDRTELTQ